MGSSGCREVPVEAAETLRDGPQCLILSHQHVGSVFGRLRRRGTSPESPTRGVFFFHDLLYPGGEQVVDSSEVRTHRRVAQNAKMPTFSDVFQSRGANLTA